MLNFSPSRLQILAHLPRLNCLHLHNRTHISLPCPKPIVHRTRHNHKDGDENTIIHRRSRDRRLVWPAAKEQDHSHPCTSKRIVGNAPPAPQAPGAPDKIEVAVSVHGGRSDIVTGLFDAAGQPAPQQESSGDHVGAVEAVDTERDDVVKRGWRAQTDEKEEHGYDGCQEDGGEGDGGARVNLRI